MSLEKEVRRARRGAGGEAAAVLLAGRRDAAAGQQSPAHAHTSSSPTQTASREEDFAVSSAEDPGVVEVLRGEVKKVSLERDALAARIGREGEVAAEAVRAELETEIAEMRSGMTPPIPRCMLYFPRSQTLATKTAVSASLGRKKDFCFQVRTKSMRTPSLLILSQFQGAYLGDEGAHRVVGGRIAKG
jgi:hypothetical protein